MLFRILDASYFNNEEAVEKQWSHDDLDSMEIVESGLSSGEVRQSIIDRCRQDLRKTKKTAMINMSLERFDLGISPDTIADKSEINGIIEDIESLLYELDDEDLVRTSWLFANEIIVVDEDQ